MSRPVWARGLKPSLGLTVADNFMSRPVWARGLKQKIFIMYYEAIMSRPVWARGLKRCLLVIKSLEVSVAPRVGAWIETFEYL